MKKQFRSLILLCCLVLNLAAYASAEPHPIKIKVYRRGLQLVRLSPNPTSTGTLSVASESRDTVHFYVFDVAGTLIYHALLLPHTKRTISDLRSGDYSYDVFRNDESVEQGKITVLEKNRRNKR